MKITSVEPQKKNQNRFNIFLDGKFAFGADEDLVVDRRLVAGKEILEEDLDKIIQEAEIGKLIERIYGLLSVRDRSEKEIRDYLSRLSFKKKLKGDEALSEMVIESLIDKLKQKGLINDEKFARAWVEARRKSKKKGIIALKQELFQKGIHKGIIDEVISSQFTANDENNLAEQALDRKLKVWKNLSLQEFRKKASEFLMRRGFEYSVVKGVVEKTLKKEYNVIRNSEEFWPKANQPLADEENYDD